MAPRDIGRNMLLSAAGNASLPLAGLVTAPILARALGVEGRGELAAVTAPLLLMTTLALLGLPEAVNYHTARDPKNFHAALRSTSWMLAAAGLLSTAGTVLAAPWLSGGDPEVRRLIVIASLAIVPTLLLSSLRGGASGLHAWNVVNAEKYIVSGVRLAAIAGLFVLGALHVGSATAILAFSPLLGALAYAAYRRYPPPVRRPAKAMRASLTRYSGKVWFGSLSGIILTRLDQAIMLPLAGSYQLGLYAAAVVISDGMLIVNNAVRDVAFSSEAAAHSPARLQAAARRSFLVSLAMAVPIAATLPLWFPLFFGRDFAAGVPVSLVLIAASLAGIPGSVAGAGLSARGRPELRSYSIVIAAAVNVVALLVLLPLLGAFGAAIATLIGNALAGGLNIVFQRRIFGMSVSGFFRINRGDVAAVAALARRTLLRRRPDAGADR